jgi:predicted alpha/beta hydrolase
MQQESLYIQDENHQLHIRHIWQHQKLQSSPSTPILLLHGTIENGKIFYTESGKGFACYLAEQGFDVYVADFRGKGKSTPAIKENPDHGQFEIITRDIPLLIDFVTQRNQQAIHVVCHSWGGVLLSSSLVRFPLLLKHIASNVCFGTKRSIGVTSLEKMLKVDLLWNRIFPKIAQQKGFIDAQRYKFGSDSETFAFLEQCISWLKPSIWLDPKDSFNYQEHSKDIKWPPTWHITGIKDSVLGHANDVKAFISESNSKAKFSLLSKQSGNHLDYDHINILTHPVATNDHFPEVVKWFKQHS